MNWSLDPAFSKNVVAVTRPATGIYCIQPAPGIDPSSIPAFGNVDITYSASPGGAQVLVGFGSTCAGQVTVATTGSTGSSTTGPVNTVSFVVLTP